MLAAFFTIKSCKHLHDCRIVLHMDNAEDCYLLIRTFDRKLSLAEAIMKLFYQLCAKRRITVAVSYVNAKRNIADAATRASKIDLIRKITGITCEDISDEVQNISFFKHMHRAFSFFQRLHQSLKHPTWKRRPKHQPRKERSRSPKRQRMNPP